MKLAVKVPLIAVLFCLTSCVLIGVLGYVKSRDALYDAAVSRLTLVAEAKRDKLKDAFDSTARNLDSLARSEGVIQGIEELSAAFDSSSADDVEKLFADPKLGPAKRSEITGEEFKESLYAWRHSWLHSAFLPMWRGQAIADAYIVRQDGKIIYSITKSDGFLKSLDGLGNDALAAIARKALQLPPGGEQAFAGFRDYRVGDGAVSAFWGQPVYTPSWAGEKKPPVAAIVFRMSDAKVGAVIGGTESDSSPLDTMLMSRDTLIRSKAPEGTDRADQDRIILKDLAEVFTASTSGATFGVSTSLDGWQNQLLIAYQPLSVSGEPYFTLAAQTTGAALQATDRMRTAMVAMTGLVLVALGGVALLLSRQLTVPIRQMADVVQRLAEGDLETEVPRLSRKDEIASIAVAAEVFKANAQRIRMMEAERIEAEHRAAQDKRQAMAAMARHFEQSVGSVIGTLVTHIEEVRQHALVVARVAGEAQSEAQTATHASELSSANVQAVSAATDQLAATVNEIGRQMSSAHKMSRQASEGVLQGDGRVQSLVVTAEQIGDIITMIQQIAARTDVLALNATIEAARAGEAGRGFAVVANEVKSLAMATSRATRDIRAKIEEVQSGCSDAGSAMRSVADLVQSLERMNSAVATAVEEQGAATTEIARNTHEAALGADKTARGISAVARASERNEDEARKVLHMCAKLASSASILRSEVDDFLNGIRTSSSSYVHVK
ncbi:methyl-accepting chemotaxis protein [Azospirillum griseum]|uniref:Methyl-accepting chemotaxis protein n=1 Tax=Azospirillum griseum TaxID=2496639 RepID=A0A431V9V3_9PROT|nr:methyl-accepting chemotaxis protein [Azospirillum griseum]RTR12768.1 methyl-accepting chemotaxis protein [Azospirillum griseum]